MQQQTSSKKLLSQFSFPLFSSQSPTKKSPTKSLLSSIKKNQNNLQKFIKSKIPKGIELNRINQFQQAQYQSRNESKTNSSIRPLDSSQNSLRNVVNESYFNQSKISKDLQKSRLITNQQRHSNKLTNHKNNNNFNIRSRSSSNLSKTPNQIFLTSNKNETNQLQQKQPKSLTKQQKRVKKQLYLSSLEIPQQIQHLLTKYNNRSFMINLIQFTNKSWSQHQQSLLEQKKIQMLVSLIIQKTNHFDQLINQFINNQINHQYLEIQRKLIISILFKQAQNTISDMKKLFHQLIGKLPQQGIMQQEFILEQLKKAILQIYDPKYTYSSLKMKQRFTLYYQAYCLKRTSLQTQIRHKLKPQLDFIIQIQDYFTSYQRQLTKLKSQVTSLQDEKQHLIQLLQTKTTFRPIAMDFQKLKQMKQASQEMIKKDFQQNIVKFHNKKHQKDQSMIKQLNLQNLTLKQQVQQKQKQIQQQILRLQKYLNSIAKKVDASTQILSMPSSMGQSNQSISNQSSEISSIQFPLKYINFLSNVVTPFSFNQKVTASLISTLTIDKILFDYQPIRNKLQLNNFKQFIFQYFVIRTGTKKVAQVLLKNFIYSLKKFRNKHKRFNTFNKICGFAGIRKKNIQQDIQYLFYQTHLAWYYVVKLSLMFRKRLSDNPSGLHIFPPLPCQQIFKLSLRKSYQLLQQFFTQQNIAIPVSLQVKLDHYSINEISKFKSHDQQYQKQALQQIHMLRQMNFDILLGFILDYVASEKAVIIQNLLRSIHLIQQQSKQQISYNQFQVVYRKYFKQKRAKIEQVYAKFSMTNMYDVLNVENMAPVVITFLQDQSMLRTLFDKHESLKSLIINDKQNLMTGKSQNKIISNPNSYQHFRQRYYNQFYDFYDTSIILQEIFKVVKNLIKKKLRKLAKDQQYIQTILADQKVVIVGEQPIQDQQQKPSDQQSNQQQNQSSNQSQQQNKNSKQLNLLQNDKTKSFFQNKLDQWNKIQQRIPHFTNKVLTIDQIVIHNMRRKQMFEGCEFAWRTLRQILTFITK